MTGWTMSANEATTVRRKEAWDAVKHAVHAYGCNPCQATEQNVEAAVRGLRAQASREVAARLTGRVEDAVPKRDG